MYGQEADATACCNANGELMNARFELAPDNIAIDK